MAKSPHKDQIEYDDFGILQAKAIAANQVRFNDAKKITTPDIKKDPNTGSATDSSIERVLEALDAKIHKTFYANRIDALPGMTVINFLSSIVPIRTSDQLEIGSDADYYADITSDLFTTKSLSRFKKDKVLMQDGKHKTALEALDNINESDKVNKRTGLKFLDKKTFPKACYRESVKAKKDIYYRGKSGKRYLRFKKGELMTDREGGLRLGQTIGFLIAVVQELKSELDTLKNNN